MTTKNDELHASVGMATSFRQQMGLLARSRRWALMLMAMVLILVAVKRSAPDLGRDKTAFVFAAMLGLALAPVWALAIWAGEWPHRRSYHWSLPVSRARHDLARVAAGAIQLMAGWTLFAGALIAGLVPGGTSIGPVGWVTFFAGPLILFFIVSPLVLWSDSRVVRGGLGVVLVLGVAALLDIPFVQPVMLSVFEADWGMEAALFRGYAAELDVEKAVPGVTPAWLAGAIATTIFAAIWRPADLARIARNAAQGR